MRSLFRLALLWQAGKPGASGKKRFVKQDSEGGAGVSAKCNGLAREVVNLASPVGADRALCHLAKAHRQVEGANVFGQRANGDEIDAGFGKFT